MVQSLFSIQFEPGALWNFRCWLASKTSAGFFSLGSLAGAKEYAHKASSTFPLTPRSDRSFAGWRWSVCLPPSPPVRLDFRLTACLPLCVPAHLLFCSPVYPPAHPPAYPPDHLPDVPCYGLSACLPAVPWLHACHAPPARMLFPACLPCPACLAYPTLPSLQCPACTSCCALPCTPCRALPWFDCLPAVPCTAWCWPAMPCLSLCALPCLPALTYFAQPACLPCCT
jgi:hypothetical protein